VSFGHTGYYRLAYRLSIADHVPNRSENEKTEPDITEAIFGDKDNASSRVYFEDLRLDSKITEEIFENTAFLKVLSSPKPTTFQHYLEQQDKSNPKALKHWNSINTRIRGYKLYWHRNTPRTGDHSWSESEVVEEGDTQHTAVTPIKPGIVFTGAIRFENLSPIELGALLFVLKLPENHYHKLGMGKPLGLGSIEIETSVLLSDRNSVSGRYTKLFSDNSWHLGNKDAGDEIKGWISEFEKYVLDIIKPPNNNGKLWDTERMIKLKKMLDFGNAQKQNWNEKTRYMRITPMNEFKDRRVLPEPEEM
jgi:CRISPR-associated protein (TIGR03986 family)